MVYHGRAVAQTESKTAGSVIVAQKGSRRGIASQPGRKIHIHAHDHPLTRTMLSSSSWVT